MTRRARVVLHVAPDVYGRPVPALVTLAHGYARRNLETLGEVVGVVVLVSERVVGAEDALEAGVPPGSWRLLFEADVEPHE